MYCCIDKGLPASKGPALENYTSAELSNTKIVIVECEYKSSVWPR